MAAAAIAGSGPLLSRRATTTPTTMLPSSAQRMKNLVLSQGHGWSTTMLGTANQSHIGANHVGNPVGNHRTSAWPTSSSGRNSDVFQIQKAATSTGNHHQPLRCQSVNASQPGWMQ